MTFRQVTSNKRVCTLIITAIVNLALMVPGAGLHGAQAAEPRLTEAPLIVGHRTIHVFRAPLGAFSAAERAEGAHKHILNAFDMTGDGWTSVKPVEDGLLVELNGKPMFVVTTADARKLAAETPADLANHASRMLQKAWSESREKRDPHAYAKAAFKVLLALAILTAGLFALFKIAHLMQVSLKARLAAHLQRLAAAGVGARVAAMFLSMVVRAFALAVGAIGIFAAFLFLTYALEQFAITRPLGEDLAQTLMQLLENGLRASTGALPGLFVVIIVFILARIVTQVFSSLFDQILSGQLNIGLLDAHTAPVTRRIVNAAIWLFALAMAYPYLPGSQTEAFKGISVILGIMVSIGAAGVVGQIASGMILVYTRALLVGEYVRIQENEGTVTELGLFVTRLRTGMGEEIALPNALVLANVTRNFSRITAGRGFVLDTTVTIGYDTPWRQVHAMLVEAARQIPLIRDDPEPYVVQTALSDFYVAYRLVVQVSADTPTTRAQVASNLNAAIQDTFNKYSVQIMSPHYLGDPAKPKLVPQTDWCPSPAISVGNLGKGPG